MAVKLEALPPLADPYKSSGGLIPFSDYSRWERRPIRRTEHPKASLVQWSRQQGASANVQSEFAKGEKGKSAPSNTTIKAKLSIRSQEPTKIKVLKVGRILAEMHG